MTRLLVSVRNADEARDALAGGADLLDVKEPERGALGAASPEVWREVLAVANGVPVSVALGELVESQPVAWPTGLQFAKYGLSGCSRIDWQGAWRRAVEVIPADVSPVAVCYADWRTARAPKPESIIEFGHALGCRAVLLDTYDKSFGSLLDLLSPDALRTFCELVRDRRMLVVLGGSLGIGSLPEILPLQPDVIAVRGAACQGGRSGVVSRELVQELKRRLSPGQPG